MSSHRSEPSSLSRIQPPAGAEDTVFAAGVDGEVHIWSFSLEYDDAHAEAVLNAEEAIRATHFRFARDRHRFVNGRASLRRILGGYLGLEASELSFSYGPAGKPELGAPHVGAGLSFNLSHSEGWALLAVARGPRLGVDQERVRAMRDLSAVAERFFAPAEAAALERIELSLRTRAFYAIWTRKEALLKAFGAGLSLPLDGFCVSADPSAPARLLSTAFRPEEAARWSLLDIALVPSPAGDFCAALAIEGPLPPYRCFRLKP
jgi:4'-phosphopantetheinyl transferase